MAIVARTLGAPGVNKTPQKNRWSPGEAAGRDGSFFLPEREDRRGLFTKRGFLNKYSNSGALCSSRGPLVRSWIFASL